MQVQSSKWQLSRGTRAGVRSGVLLALGCCLAGSACTKARAISPDEQQVQAAPAAPAVKAGASAAYTVKIPGVG